MAATPHEQHAQRDQSPRLGPLRLDLPIHPILFALAPVISLLVSNLEYVAVEESFRAMLAVCLLAAALTGAAWLVVRDWRMAALIASPGLILLLSYGHLYSGLKLVFGALDIRHLYLVPMLLVGLAGWAAMVRRHLRSTTPLTSVLNLVGGVALLLPLIMLGRAYLSGGVADFAEEDESLPDADSEFFSGPEGRDIYYIVLDGYGRQDVLLDIYGHDNSPFLAALEARGFQVAEQSAANYIQTALSLASSLNMDYLDDVLRRRSQTMTNKALIDLIWHSGVRRQLEARGYTMVAYRTAFPYTSVGDAELFLFPEGQADEEERSNAAARAGAFEVLLFESGLGRVLVDFSPAARDAVRQYAYEPLYEEHRTRVLFTLDSLGDVPDFAGRHFVFAHVVSPHPPFVFDAEGNPLTPDHPFSFADGSHFRQYGYGTRKDYIDGYREQLRYVNELVLAAIDEVLAISERQPIIIIQGDHGPGAYLRWDDIMDSNFEERSGILNAFLLPGAPPDAVYPTMSPVNAFRLVLSLYFGADLPPLHDCVLFSTTGDRAHLQQVGGCIDPARSWSAGMVEPAAP